MVEATALYAQSFLDVVLQATGCIDALVEVAKFNDLSITDDLMAGQKIKFPESVKIDNEIVSYYKAKKVNPATALNTTDKEEITQSEGIGYWKISVDFVIQ